MIRFETAQPKDKDELTKLVNSAYRGDTSKEGWTTEADLLGGQRTDPEKILEMITDPNSRIEMAVNETGQVAGCVFLKYENPGLYLGMLTVSPALQSKGLGKIILGRVEEIALELGAEFIRMTVISIRKELIAFYERRGYQKTGKTEPFPDHDPRFGIPKTRGLEFCELIKKI